MPPTDGFSHSDGILVFLFLGLTAYLSVQIGLAWLLRSNRLDSAFGGNTGFWSQQCCGGSLGGAWGEGLL